ncbi:MAG: DUF72 domain-containing protein [Candidatus Omnitrophica bacterium]|nr:DUF72 domain-containing protein [Candidatus Omnitrophota bacterium]MCM8793617.1 DUF72 domain-containing protein [Candidatus Omnitrophota bacterium]
MFYPKELRENKWLEYYCKFFNTVELNVTFYRLPPKNVFKNWYKRVPEEFLFVAKGSRYITHVKKLKDTKDALIKLFDLLEELKEKLGVVLWQFPPGMKVELKRMEEFFKQISKYKVRQAFEFRHPSWFREEIYNLLKEYNFSLCLAHSPYWPLVEVITSDFVYLRFHGGTSLYGSNYSEKELQTWAEKAKIWLGKGLDFYAYFNNDAYGYAVKNALRLREILTKNKNECGE